MNGALGILTEPDVQVPMRDGVRMAAHVFRPDADGRFPGILLRTPYGRPKPDRNHNTGRNDLADPELVVATNAVHHSAAHPSRLVLPVSEG